MATRAIRRLRIETAAFAPRTLAARPLTPVIGAEIEGVDLSRPLGPDQYAEIRQALNLFHVLVFRDQHLTAEDHKRFGRMFGRLHSHPYHSKAGTTDGSDPEIYVVKADESSGHAPGEEWHTDVTCHEEPPMGSMLHVTRTPDIGSGGDTMFASTAAAYDALSAPIRRLIDPLSAVHDGARLYVDGYDIAPPPQGWPRAVHPVVARHPETGRKCLYVNRGFTTRIVELQRNESDAILELLMRHVETQPELQCRVRWAPNTLVFWDNRATQHKAVWDYFPHARYGQRVSIVGERPRA